METRKHIAAEKKRCNSHNCAQAILHTYADVVGISEQEAMEHCRRLWRRHGKHGRNMWRIGGCWPCSWTCQ